MDLFTEIKSNYNFDSIKKITSTKHGMGRTYIVETNDYKYLFKLNERIDFVRLYHKISVYLNKKNMVQSRIIKTKTGNLLTEKNAVLYEYIPGNTYKTLSREQMFQAIEFIKKYNCVLKNIPFNQSELDHHHPWDKAISLQYIMSELPVILKENDVNNQYINQAIIYLKENANILKQNQQLIHTDLGPDNFLFNNDKIISILDFTPGYDHELYSIAQFVYWNYLHKDLTINNNEIQMIFKKYDKKINDDVIYPLLIKAALYRIIGPLLDQIENKRQINIPQKRLEILMMLIKK